MRTRVQQEMDDLSVQVTEAAALARSADLALVRMSNAERHVSQELARLGESVEDNQLEFASLVENLDTGLAQWAAAWRKEVDERLAGLRRQIGPAPTDLGRRLGGNRKFLRAELGRIAEAIEETRAQSVTKDDLMTLRAEFKTALAHRVAFAQAELERRFAVLDAVVADAKAKAGSAAPIRSDVQGLQVEVQELTTVVSELQASMSPPHRKPAPRRKPPSAEKAAAPAKRKPKSLG